MKVKRDELGLFVACGGWEARPYHATQFQEGDEVKTHHYGGTPFGGVGKDDACRHGEYLEQWMTCGIPADESMSLDEKRANRDWYFTHFGPQCANGRSGRPKRVEDPLISVQALQDESLLIRGKKSVGAMVSQLKR